MEQYYSGPSALVRRKNVKEGGMATVASENTASRPNVWKRARDGAGRAQARVLRFSSSLVLALIILCLNIILGQGYVPNAAWVNHLYAFVIGVMLWYMYIQTSGVTKPGQQASSEATNDTLLSIVPGVLALIYWAIRITANYFTSNWDISSFIVYTNLGLLGAVAFDLKVNTNLAYLLRARLGFTSTAPAHEEATDN